MTPRILFPLLLTGCSGAAFAAYIPPDPDASPDVIPADAGSDGRIGAPPPDATDGPSSSDVVVEAGVDAPPGDDGSFDADAGLDAPTTTDAADAADACLSHPNGLGQSYTDCAPLGVPGFETSYTQTMALEACAAWTGSMVACHVYPVSCGNGAVAADGAGLPSCPMWAFAGSVAGYVKNLGIPGDCTCPTTADKEWR